MFKDKEYFSAILRIGIPIALQNLLTSSLSLFDTMMIGQLGDHAIAAVGLSNQVSFILNLMLFGIANGQSVFVSQFWGKKDMKSIYRILGIALMSSLLLSALFTIATSLMPGTLLSFYTNDPNVIQEGIPYLRTLGFSFLAMAISFVFRSSLRSTEHVKLPTILSISNLILKLVISFILIFGRFGLPAMGILGGAVGTSIARVLESVALVIFSYRMKTPAAAPIADLLVIDRKFTLAYYKTTLPVIINETLWSFGISTINSVYAHLSTESIAAMNVCTTIEGVFFFSFFGMASACGILVGKAIGEGEPERARRYVRRSLTFGLLMAMVVSVLLYLSARPVLNFFNLSAETNLLALRVLQNMAKITPVRISLFIFILGVLRPGGDVRFSLAIDGFGIWLLGVPLAYLGANLLGLPIYQLYLFVMIDELVKVIVCFFRFRSGKWLHDLTQIGRQEEPALV
ncbi:MAG: MATE family efflux transporter [Anaerolineaceae bacterium]|nr:MATE family efflux transporter [Anaerolineaceae bacterium]